MKAEKEPKISDNQGTDMHSFGMHSSGMQDGDGPVPVPVSPVRNEKDILNLIKQENSWEQVLYQVVALEDMDPWNLDINVLCKGFADYVAGISELDFRIPAKWVIIASILLRMKSDCIKIMRTEEEPDDEFRDLEELAEMAELEEDESKMDLEPIEAVSRRIPVRRVTITELVNSLKKVVRAEERREVRLQQRRNRIKISSDDITVRIDNLYKKIGDMLIKIKENEIKFTKLVGSWKRGRVVDTFLPLIHLDHDKKVSCRQEKIFKEIFIRKREDRKKPKAS